MKKYYLRTYLDKFIDLSSKTKKEAIKAMNAIEQKNPNDGVAEMCYFERIGTPDGTWTYCGKTVKIPKRLQ